MSKQGRALCLGLLLLLCGLAEGAEPVRCALMVDRSEELRSSAFVSLLETRLSQGSLVQLVERSRIEAILREQQISLSASAEPETIVKAGRLLRVDAFILLSVESSAGGSPGTSPLESSGQLLRVRVTETAHGLRLWDRCEELDESNVPAAADRIAENVGTVVQKIGLPVGQVIPVGIVDIHRVQLPERYERLARVLPGLLSARLSAETRVLMLEREDLGTLLKEKQLTDGNDAAFWSSTILIDGYLQPDPNAGVQIRLRLRRPDGAELRSFVAPVDPQAPVSVIHPLAVRIAQSILNAAPSASWDAAREAEEFYRQGEMLMAHDRRDIARSALETAYALDPDNVYGTGALFVNALPAPSARRAAPPAESLRSPAMYSDLEIAELASVFVRQIREGYERGTLSARDIYERWVRGTGPLGNSNYFLNPMSVSAEQVRQINHENRRIWVELFDTVLQEDARTTRLIPSSWGERASLVWIREEEPEELLKKLKVAFAKFVLPPEMGGVTPSALERNRAYSRAFMGGRSLPRSVNRREEMDAEFQDAWLDFLEEMSQVDDPVVRYNCCLDLASTYTRGSRRYTQEKARQYAYAAVYVFRQWLEDANDFPHLYPYVEAVRVKRCLQRGLATSSELFQISADICRPLLAKQDALALAFWDPGSDVSARPAPVAQEWYDLLERVRAVLQTHLEDKRVSFAMDNVQNALARIRIEFPDVVRARTEARAPVTLMLSRLDWPAPPDPNHVSPRTAILFEPLFWSRAGFMLWVSFAARAPSQRPPREPSHPQLALGLAGIDLEKKRATSLWQAAIWSSLADQPGLSTPNGKLTGLALSDRRSYLSVEGMGLVALPGTATRGRALFVDPNGPTPIWQVFYPPGASTNTRQIRGRNGTPIQSVERRPRGTFQKPTVLTEKNGLPSLFLTSIAGDGDRLWLAYGARDRESGLGLYDPHTGRWDNVFCSALPGPVPFGSGRPYCIRDLRLGKADKLFFVLTDPTGYAFSPLRPWVGLWSMDTTTHQATFLGPEGGTLPVLGPYLADAGDAWWLWWTRSDSGITEFDPVTGVLGRIDWSRYAGLVGVDRRLEGVAIHNGTLWGRWARDQIVIIDRDKRAQDAAMIPNYILKGEPVAQFLSTPYGLVAIGSGLVGLIEKPEAVGNAGKEE